jgi:hypothetical protein
MTKPVFEKIKRLLPRRLHWSRRPGTVSASRRALLAGILAAPLARKAVSEAAPPEADGISGATRQWEHLSLKHLKGELPKGKIGDLEISRLIFGSNLIGGHSHSRDLIYVSRLFREYNTEAKVFETLHLAEQAGINTMVTPSHELPLIRKYLEVTDGKMQAIAQCYPTTKDLTGDIDKAIDNGATALYVQGAHADRFVADGQIDMLAKALQHMKDQGYLAGIGAHSVEVPIACEREGLDPDFYMKTCHHDEYWSAHPREKRREFCIIRGYDADHDGYHDNIFDLFPEKTVEFMETVKKPWIAFKVLAGGAIHPMDGFRYAFKNGADFICVGAFDFQVVEDVNIALRALDAAEGRHRPWYG